MDAGCVAVPGAFNGAVAYAVRAAGFEACYVSGGAVSVAAGVPDVGLLGLEHFCRVIREVSRSSGLPVLADADTGFGEGEMVRQTVIEYARAGAGGLHIEDQVFPKRCGHLEGKTLTPIDHMVEKVEWGVKAAQDCSDGAFVVCARTDAAGVEGFDAAVERARAYAAGGADMIFPEGLRSEEEFERFARELKSDTGPYLLANMTEFGKTPIIPLDRFAEMGYDCVIYPVTTLRVTLAAVTLALETLKRDGHVESFMKDMMPRGEMYGLIGYDPAEAWELPG